MKKLLGILVLGLIYDWASTPIDNHMSTMSSKNYWTNADQLLSIFLGMSSLQK